MIKTRKGVYKFVLQPVGDGASLDGAQVRRGRRAQLEHRIRGMCVLSSVIRRCSCEFISAGNC